MRTLLADRRIWLGLVATFAMSAPALAALAPQYDRLAQFQAVAGDSKIADALSEHGLITGIDRLEDGSFRVWTENCSVPVTLEAVPPKEGTVGPTTYKTTIGKASCAD